jgi:hypothetical protein
MDDFKITDAQQTKIINNFKNVQQKLLKINAAIYFSRIYRRNLLAH